MVEQRCNIIALREVFGGCVSDNGDESVLSVAYLALLGRHGFDIYSQDGVHVVVCAHPNDRNILLVLPEITQTETKNADVTSLLPTVLKSLAHEQKEVRLARFSQDQLARLRQKLSLQNQDTIIQIETVREDQMDWLFPAHILSTKAVAEMEGAAFKRIRKKVNTLLARHEISQVSIHEPDMLNKMRFIMTRWESKMILDGKADMGKDVVTMYESLFLRLQETPALFDGRVFFVDGQPAGLTIWDNSVKNNAILLVNLNDHSIQDLSTYQIVETCRSLDDLGVRYCDLGGSEEEGLNRFKESFRPEQSLHLQSAIVRFNRPQLQKKTLIGWSS